MKLKNVFGLICATGALLFAIWIFLEALSKIRTRAVLANGNKVFYGEHSWLYRLEYEGVTYLIHPHGGIIKHEAVK